MRWNSNLAYAIGLITTDGCLSKDGRHIDLTSKDLDQIKTFAKILNLNNKIGLKSRSKESIKEYYRIQFSNVKFYKFLVRIGLTPHKSKTLGSLNLPDKYFADFLRGCLDGDGCVLTYWDKRWKTSFRLYLSLCSASLNYITWLKMQIKRIYEVDGAIKSGTRVFVLEFAKMSSLILIEKMYYRQGLPCLKRKRFKIEQALGIISRQAGVEKSVDSLA